MVVLLLFYIKLNDANQLAETVDTLVYLKFQIMRALCLQ